LQYAAELLNRVIAGVEGVRIGLHVCRGNWSRNEAVLLSGDYTPLLPAFEQMQVQQYVLEYATPRAGEIDVVGQALRHKELGLGVVNPRTAEAEPVEWIVERVEQALTFYPPQAIFLNPDCGFGCFANRCVNDEQTATAKLRQMVKSAQLLREKYG
jgi:5-methyltetrahydropteroyltriglutamate--homocysteine methyltransferase